MMGFSGIFDSGTQVCFVFPFKFSLSCVIFDDDGNGVRYDYDRWKRQVSSELIDGNDSSDSCWRFSWYKVPCDSLNSSNCEFLPNCFLRGEITDAAVLKCFDDCLIELELNGVVSKVSRLEIKLWEFGFGSIKIVSEVIQNETEDKSEAIGELLDNFQTLVNKKLSKVLKSKIDREIIKRCNLRGQDDAKVVTSFAERDIQYKNEDGSKSEFDLLDPIVIVQCEAKDENDFKSKNDVLSSDLHGMKIENKIINSRLGIYISDNRKSVVSIFQQNSKVSDEIMETVIVHKNFADHCNIIYRTYEPFLSSYYEKIAKEGIFPKITHPTKRSFAWNALEEQEYVPRILAEIREFSKIDTIKFSVFDEQANSYLSYSNFSIFKSIVEIFGLNRSCDSKKELISFVNNSYDKISDHVNKLSLVFGKTLGFGASLALAIFALIISIAASIATISTSLDPSVSNFEEMLNFSFVQWMLLGVTPVAIIIMSVTLLGAKRAEKKEIDAIKDKRKDIKPHQLWIEIIKNEKQNKKLSKNCILISLFVLAIVVLIVLEAFSLINNYRNSATPISTSETVTCIDAAAPTGTATTTDTESKDCDETFSLIVPFTEGNWQASVALSDGGSPVAAWFSNQNGEVSLDLSESDMSCDISVLEGLVSFWVFADFSSEEVPLSICFSCRTIRNSLGQATFEKLRFAC